MNQSLSELLAHKLNRVSDTPAGGVDSEFPVNAAPVSETALVVDEWGMRRGRELSGEYDELLMADCHAAMFEPRPEIAENCSDSRKSRWFADLMQDSEYQALHLTTQGDAGLSEITASTLAQAYTEYAKDNPEEADSVAQDINRASSVRQAMQQCKKDSDSAIEFAVGIGNEPGVTGQIPSDKLAESFKLTRNHSRLRRIFEAAGRYRRFARAAQKSKVKHGYDDMIGIKLGDSIPDMLASELGRLAVPTLRTELLRRLVERQALCREYQGEEKLGLGPIVVLVDESSSMDGDNIVQAKAIALTMAWIAKQQRRWVAFASFNSLSHGRTLVMPPSNWDQASLIEWVEAFSRGGTALTLLLETLPNQYWKEWDTPKGKTDIIVITDGAVDAEPAKVQTFNVWRKAEKAKCYGLILDGTPGGLKGVCDRYWLMDDLSLGQDGVKEVLSI
jgi:uncharacterized protein with von Willebrand factor type A (vWA) domain